MTNTVSPAGSQRAVFLGGMASYLDGATLVSLGLSIVLFAPAFHLTPILIGALVSGFQLAFAAGAIIGGRLGDVFGRKAIYSIDLLVFALGLLGVVLAPNSTILVISLLLTGLAVGADVPTSLALVFEEAKSGKRGSAIGFTQTLFLTGALLTQILGFGIADMGIWGARILFLHPLIVSIVVYILRRRVKESPAWEALNNRPKAERANRDLRNVFRKPWGIALLATVLFFIFGTAITNILGQYSTYLIVTISGADNRFATAILFASTLVGLVCTIIFQRIVNGRFRGTFMISGVILTAFGCGVAIATHFAVWSVVIMVIFGSFGGSWAGEALYKVWSQEIFPTAIRSSAQGLTYGVGKIAMSGYGFFTPLLATGSPIGLMIFMGGGSLVAGIIGAVWISRLPRGGTVTERVSVPERQSLATE